ncbi:hypothetical protein J6590_075565 [Homalodisca vitripennis]|nr:hypothetical protein J6590_075565 [Homalodisca vitripennis]
MSTTGLAIETNDATKFDADNEDIYPSLPSSQVSTPSNQVNRSNRYTPLQIVTEPNSIHYSTPIERKTSGTSYRKPSMDA